MRDFPLSLTMLQIGNVFNAEESRNLASAPPGSGTEKQKISKWNIAKWQHIIPAAPGAGVVSSDPVGCENTRNNINFR